MPFFLEAKPKCHPNRPYGVSLSACLSRRRSLLRANRLEITCAQRRATSFLVLGDGGVPVLPSSALQLGCKRRAPTHALDMDYSASDRINSRAWRQFHAPHRAIGIYLLCAHTHHLGGTPTPTEHSCTPMSPASSCQPQRHGAPRLQGFHRAGGGGAAGGCFDRRPRVCGRRPDLAVPDARVRDEEESFPRGCHGPGGGAGELLAMMGVAVAVCLMLVLVAEDVDFHGRVACFLRPFSISWLFLRVHFFCADLLPASSSTRKTCTSVGGQGN